MAASRARGQDTSPPAAIVPKYDRTAFILITSMFFAWGLANNMTDTLLVAFKKIMSMSDFETAFVQYAFYGAYFCFALPAALMTKRFTYKTGILFGLALFIIGGMLFYPASQTMHYMHFLAALYILAGGLAFLETSSNPYVLALGPEQTATQRLNLAQSFNPIGSMTGVLLSKIFILSHLHSADAAARRSMSADQLHAIQQDELSAVMGPYVGVAGILAVLWLIMALTRMPRASDAATTLELGATLKRLLGRRRYVASVVAQFFYVGAQIGIWSFTIRYVMANLGVNEAAASSYYLAALLLFVVSRFLCTAAMQVIRPTVLLAMMALLALLLTVIAVFEHGTVGVYALVGVSGCMSLMFPTIYGIGLVIVAAFGFFADRRRLQGMSGPSQ
ncbi:MAG: L-fucose:H+ symporter permease [Alphaproteobacteria bacterium]|nr:MAG: L-fucose:H+ symporter permease [Alphaproteobacteria bacterium]